jgi:hypothetical protein
MTTHTETPKQLSYLKCSLHRLTLPLALGALVFGATYKTQADLAFDNITTAPNITGTSSTPNTFMGGAYTLSAGTTALTGFDLFPVNFTTSTFTAIKATVYVWGTVNTGAVSAGSPAFGNLLGTYTQTFTVSSGFAPNTYLSIEDDGVSTPGFALGSPLAISGTTIGLTFSYQGATDGVTFSTINSLTSLISYGAPASVGANVFNGYYRNANSEVDGNFTSSLRSLGLTDQSVAVRIYGDVTVVPEPASMALAGLGCAVLVIFRRRR